MMPTVASLPRVRRGAPDLGRQPIDEGALAGARRAGDADEIGAARPAEDRAHQIGARLLFVFDEGDGARDGPRLAGQHAIGQRGGHESSCRAMTSR